MTRLTASLVVSLVDQASRRAHQITGAVERMQHAAARNQRALSAMQGQWTAAIAAGFALQRAIAAPVMAAANYETAMNRVQALTSATATEMGALSRQSLELGRTTQFTATQAAGAQGFLAQAGFEADEILGAMPGTLQLAAAAQMDLARSADIVSNVLTGYGMEVAQLGRVNDVLVATFTSANTDLSQLGEAMKYAGPIASAAGVEFETAAAAIALMGNAGIQGSMAGTSLRNSIRHLLDPTNQVQEAMDRVGLTVTDAEGRLLPFADIIEQLEPHADDAGLMMEIFGARAGPALAAVVSQGAAALRELEGELRNSEGTAARIADTQMRGFNGFLLRMQSALEGLAIAIGQSLNPALQSLGEMLIPVIEAMTQFVEANPEMAAAAIGLVSGLMALKIATIGARLSFLLLKGGVLDLGIALGTVTGKLAGLVAKLAPVGRHLRAMAVGATMLKAVGAGGALTAFITGLGPLIVAGAPLALVAAAIVAIGLAVHKYWEPISGFVGGFAEQMGELAGPAIEGLKGFASDMASAAAEFATDTIIDVGAWLGIDEATMRQALDVAQQIVVGAFQSIASAVQNAVADLGGWFTSLFQMNDYTDAQEAEFRDAGARLAQAIWDGFTGILGGLGDWVSGILDGIVERFSAAANAAQGLSGSADRRPSSQTLDSHGWVRPDGARALGGQIVGGRTYLLGEYGPELVRPQRSGYVHSAPETRRMLAASGPADPPMPSTVTVSISMGDVHIPNATNAEEVAQEIGQRLREEMHRLQADTTWAVA